ncbi:UNVERIFIED_CONTAM: hypothetical protein FKN15_006794, partial [Acipenser sinensis]
TGENTTIIIKSSFPKANCSVCVLKDKQLSCSSELRLQPRENRTYSFSCPEPHKFFTIEISKNTVCISNFYSTEVKELLSLAFPKFNNTLIWDINFSENKALVLDFLGSGLRQIKPSESCPDHLTYSILTYLTAEIQSIGTFCRRGPVSKIQVDKGARVSLQMSGKEEVDEPGFSMAIGPPIKKFCIIEVKLLPGSSVNLLSPNYPLSFSDDDLMSWMFTVPENNKASVLFLNYTQPNCNKKSESVEYAVAGYQSTIGKSLTDQQPSSIRGNFEMQLENCKMDKSDPGKLSLEFRVEAFNESQQSCYNWEECPVKEMPLKVPISLAKLHVPLESLTWQLRAPTASTVVLSPGKAKLKYLLPGDKCREGFYYRLVKEDESELGKFCPQGSIEKVQIHSNISVVLLALGNHSQILEPFFNVTFEKEIADHFWIDLQKEKGINVTIKQKKVNPNCQICVGAACQPEITLQSGKKTKVIFKDCNLEELGMAVTKDIGMNCCYNWEECPVKEMPLKVPISLAKLHVPLESLTWQLRAPTASTVVLSPGKAKLKYLLPGDKCREGFYYRLVEEDESELGKFCPQGSIEKVQIHSNISVVLLALGNHSQILEPFFNVTFEKEITDHFWIDLQKEKGINVTIKQKKVNPNCQICVGAACQPEITLQSGKKTKVIFKDCNLEELGMAVTKDIGMNCASSFSNIIPFKQLNDGKHVYSCYNWEECPVKEMPLKVPISLAKLHVPLESLTWQLRAPTASTVVLSPGKAKLKYLLPGDKCREGFYYRLVKEDESELGKFCPQGSIEKVQIHSNISVVLLALGNHSQILEPFFNVTFEKEIAESYIFTVSPELGVMSYLVTPNWPKGMDPLSSVSWKVSVPPGHMVQVSFLNATQPECQQSHTSVSIKGQSSVEEELSRREDELLPEHQTMTEDFWLNMSNCKLEATKKTFKVMCRVTLIEKQDDLIMKIAIGTLSAVLVIVAFIVIISCVMKKKKKKKIQTSVYNPNVNTFFPGHPLFSKGRRDNDSHVYADIDETMMYGQLLRGPGMTPLPEVDVYRPFEGPVGDRPPTPPPLFNRGKSKAVGPEVDVYRPFLGPVGDEPPIPIFNREASMQAVVDSKLYTFQQHEQEAETPSNEDELPLPPADEEMEQNKEESK